MNISLWAENKSVLNRKKLFLLLPIMALLAAGCFSNSPSSDESPPVVTPRPTITATPTPSTTPSSTEQSTLYENQFMKLTVPAGWALTEVTVTTQNQTYDKNTGKTTLIGEPVVKKTGAVDITKGNYVLYINPQASQASGVEGGRFAEIAMGAPSADAVVTEQPSPPCGVSEIHSAFAEHNRVDLYVSAKDKKDYCAVPTNGKNVWYFSYVTDLKNQTYFNYYKTGEPLAFVITMAYNSKTINNFPIKDSAELTSTLTQMTDITKTLEIKPN